MKISNVSLSNYYELFDTQSQNESAKIALCVDEFFVNHHANTSRKSYDWHQLDDILYTSHEAFVFVQTAFYFRMFKKIIDPLIDTGIMKHLSENYYTKKLKFETFQSLPKVLCVNDLTFGFNIWFGSCCFSIIIFVAEFGSKMMKNRFERRNKIIPQNNSHDDDQNELQIILEDNQIETEREKTLDEIIDEILAIDMENI